MANQRASSRRSLYYNIVLTSSRLIISRNYWCFAVTGGTVLCGNSTIISTTDWEYQEGSDALSLITIGLAGLWSVPRVPTEVSWDRLGGKGVFVREGIRIRVDQSGTK